MDEINHSISHLRRKSFTRLSRIIFGFIAMACGIGTVVSESPPSSPIETVSLFEKTVEIIKKYEGLHKNKGNLVGYGHKILPADLYKRNQNLTEAEADALLRKDLLKLCEKYRSFGKDSLLLSALAYNCGIGVVAKSTVLKNLKEGNRDIKQSYLSHCRSRGKVLSQLKRRRMEEFENLFIP